MIQKPGTRANKNKKYTCRIDRGVKKILGFFAPLCPIAAFYLMGLAVFSLFRVLLCVSNMESLLSVAKWYMVFPIGVRMDTLLLCYAMALPLVLTVLLPARPLKWALSLYFSAFLAVAVFLEIASFPFMEEFSTRPDRLFIEHVGNWNEISGMILKGYSAELLFGLLATALSAALVMVLYLKMFKNYSPAAFSKRLILCIVCLPLVFLGARSSISHRPANPSTAAFSSSHLVNQLGLNSSYSLMYAWNSLKKHETDPSRVYGKMKLPEMLGRIKKYMVVDGYAENSPIPLLHAKTSTFPNKKPYNLVIILEESLGAEYVGCLGGLPLTPKLDQLSKEGLLFTNLYATGTRTVRGIEATVCGFLPTPGSSVVKLGLSQQRFFSLADLLQRRGYATEFIYGGDSQFDNMRSFFFGNGFQKIYDLKTFDKPVFEGTWGVSDEDLFIKANEVFKSHGDAPFFALLLSTSNHDPFEFPDGRITLYEQPKMTRHNAMKYADYALGAFFDMAKNERYYENTVFLVIADHSTRLRGQDLLPIHKFRIPALIIGPNVQPGKYHRVASQIDMPPTLLDLMGISARTPLIGRPLLSLPDDIPGRAVMQYGSTQAFMVGDDVLIQRPNMEPVQAVYKEGKMTKTAVDPELARDALAHALLPAYLYRKQLYCLQQDEKPIPRIAGRSRQAGKKNAS